MMALLKTFLLVLIAEIGDKTQLICMAFASKYKVRDVAIGVAAATVLLNSLAVILGSCLSSIVPFNYIQIIAAFCFIGFGLWTIKGENDEEEEVERKTKFGPIVTIATTFFIAELGDKTQLMTFALAAQFKQPVFVLSGAVLGMLIADGIGIAGGAWLKRYIPDTLMKWGAAFIFLAFGVITLFKALPERFIKAIYIIPCFIVLGLLIYFTGFRSGSKKEDKA